MCIRRKGDSKMHKYKIFTLVLSAACVVTLVGCRPQRVTSSSENSSSNTSSSSSSSSSQGQDYILSAVDQKDEFVEFLSNRNKSSSQADGFYANDRAYTVGDDNPFNVKPELTVLDGKTYTPVSSSRWAYDFEISAKMDGSSVNADSTYFSVVDAANADVQFTSAAIGHTFVITVTPTHIAENKVAQFTKSFEVTVADGYNVYNAKELGYFDTRALNSTEGEESAAIEAGFVNKWQEFKIQNNMDPNIKPSALIMHEDLKITKDDVPANFFYTEAEAEALSDGKSAGSLKDRTYIYKHTTNNSAILNGNYFGLDISEMPLIKRENHQTTATGKVVAHSSLFRVDDGSAQFLNLKLTGNAPRAEKDEDTIYGGGLMFIKAARRTLSVSLDNMIARDLFITVMTERPDNGYPVLTVNFSKAKCSNNYNSFVYNWGGKFIANDSSFSNCGGPVVIQDHWVEGDSNYDSEHGQVVNGYAPESTFNNCVLNNFVAGSEAWFQQFNATTLVPTIKSLSDLYYGAGVGKGVLVDQNHNACIYQSVGNASFFNFVALNKSSAAQGMTAYPVCGKVSINNGEKASYFDYRQPANDPVYLAYVAYATNPTAENQQALIQTAVANGVTFASDYSDVNDQISAYITAKCTEHEILRGLNANGAPVMDLGNGTALASTDGSTPSLLDAAALAASSITPYSLSAQQKAALGDYTTLYFNGMALVFGLYSYAA